jgi:guanylate kinase
MSIRGNLFIISAPSGAGKTSLVKELVQNIQEVSVSVSHTTRAPRPGEENGVHYHFSSIDDFKALIAEDAFLEWAEVFGNYYGTTKQAVDDELNKGQDVILEIDWQGAEQVMAIWPDATSIFILPPSVSELQNRLSGRGQDSAAVIARRLLESRKEMSHYVNFDYLVVNDVFSVALEELQTIFKAKRLCRDFQVRSHTSLIDDLLSNAE